MENQKTIEEYLKEQKNKQQRKNNTAVRNDGAKVKLSNLQLAFLLGVEFPNVDDDKANNPNFKHSTTFYFDFNQDKSKLVLHMTSNWFADNNKNVSKELTEEEVRLFKHLVIGEKYSLNSAFDDKEESDMLTITAIAILNGWVPQESYETSSSVFAFKEC